MMAYNVGKAVAYAHKWAFKRNPRFYDFDNTGGDCTNFISQCLYAGSGVMNYTPTTGWYFNSLSSRAPAWTGVQFLYNFLVKNKGRGPYGHEADIYEARPGDVVQLSFDGVKYAHSLFVVSTGMPTSLDNILITTHTYDSDNRPLSTYFYSKLRLIRIDGARS